MDVLAGLREQAAHREAAGLRRVLRPRAPDTDAVTADGTAGGRAELDLASNDYLGLTRDPRVVEGAVAAAHTWGAGATGSRLVSGSTQLHTALEATLAAFVGAAAGLVFSSGYTANLAVLTSLARRGSLVVSDAGNHASIVDGCRLSRAEVVVVAHRDVAAVDRALAGGPGGGVVVTDAIFSVDGDLAPLRALHDVVRTHGALLVVDEAHALGVVGEGGSGAAVAAGLAGQPDVVLTATLSKSLGAQGGAVLADAVVIEHLVNEGRSFIFDTGLAPASAGAALAALQLLRDDPSLAQRARSRAIQLGHGLAQGGLTVRPPEAAVVSVVAGSPERAVAAAAACLDAGVRVGCFRPPSVPDGASRLRLTARADLTDDAVALAVDVVSRSLR